MSTTVHLGFEVGTGRAISVPIDRHLAVTGQTQVSGKTTTLEALVSRSGLRAVAFVTKRGETSFRVSNPIPPYFRERADWRFVQSLLEATMHQKMRFEQAWIIRASKGAHTLGQVQKNIREALKTAKGISASVYECLNAYCDEVIPELNRLPYSKKLDLRPGVNVMDLSAYGFGLQSLVIRSVLEAVYETEKNVVVVIPEAWEFIPQDRGSPVRLAAEELIRKGGTNKNFVWIDSQDIAGVHKAILRQATVWIVGVQRESNEVTRVMKQFISKPARPLPEEIMTLGKGEFYACWDSERHKVYVQPAWMEEAHARAIARGEIGIETVQQILQDLDRRKPKTKPPEYRVVGPAHDPTIIEIPNGPAAAPAVRDEYTPEEIKPKPDPPMTSSARPAQSPLIPRASVDEQVLYKTPLVLKAWVDEEAMYKEKFEAAQREIARLKEQLRSGTALQAAVDRPSLAATSPTFDLPEGVYKYVKSRLLEEPEVIALLDRKPRIEITLERPTIQLDGNNLPGKIARLVADGFFAEPRKLDAIGAEMRRRGMIAARMPTNLLQPRLSDLMAAGFLTLEPEGYHVVEGMEVNLKES